MLHGYQSITTTNKPERKQNLLGGAKKEKQARRGRAVAAEVGGGEPPVPRVRSPVGAPRDGGQCQSAWGEVSQPVGPYPTADTPPPPFGRFNGPNKATCYQRVLQLVRFTCRTVPPSARFSELMLLGEAEALGSMTLIPSSDWL